MRVYLCEREILRIGGHGAGCMRMGGRKEN